MHLKNFVLIEFFSKSKNIKQIYLSQYKIKIRKIVSVKIK